MAWFIQLTQKEKSAAHSTHSSERATDVPARAASSEAATGDRTTTRRTGGVLARETPRTAASSSSHASKRRRADAMADRFLPNDLRHPLFFCPARHVLDWLTSRLLLQVVEEMWAKAGQQVMDYMHALHGGSWDGDAAVLPGHRQPWGPHPRHRHCPGVAGPAVRLIAVGHIFLGAI
jgi:hypothetical protein